MKKFSQLEIIVSFLCGVISFVVYAFTSAHSIVFTDNGELLGVMSTFGVPHPTGSPLFMLFAGVWNATIGYVTSTIWSKNLFSSFIVSLGIFTLHLCLLRLVDEDLLKKYNPYYRYIVSSSIVLMIAFSISTWEIATFLEIYSIQFFAFSVVFLSFIHWSKKPSIQNSFLVTYLSSLAVLSHSSMVFFAIAINVILIIYNLKQEKNYKHILVSVVLAMFAGSVYAVPILRSFSEVPFNWGEISRSFDAFYYHISGKQFQVWMFESEETFFSNALFFGKELLLSTLGIGVLLSGIGLFYLWKKNTLIVLVSLFYFVIALPFVFSYGIPDIKSYFVVPIALFSILGGMTLFQWLVTKQWLAMVVFLLPCISIGYFWNDVEQQNNSLVEDYTHILIDQIPKNSIILSSQWDYFCSAFWFKQKIEGIRTDIVLIEKELLRRTWYPRMVQRWYPEVYKKSEKEFETYLAHLQLFESGKKFDASKLQRLYIVLLRSIIENSPTQSVDCTPEILQSEPNLAEGYKTIPQGLVIQVSKNTVDTTFSVKKIDVNNFFSVPIRKRNYLEQSIHRTFMVSMGYTSSYLLSNGKLEEGIRAKDLSTTSSIILKKVK